MTKAEMRERAIDWIAWNDEPEDTDPQSVADYLSTQVAAHILATDPDKLAKAIARRRRTRR